MTKQRPPNLLSLQGPRIIANHCSTRTATSQAVKLSVSRTGERPMWGKQGHDNCRQPKYLNPTRRLLSHAGGKENASITDKTLCEIAGASRLGVRW
jgi:hypothetical protein